MKTLFTLSFILLTIIVFGQRVSKTPVKTVPSTFIYDINGLTTNLQTISKGKVTLIDFWFIPCGPCFAEMNMLHKLYAKYKNNPKVCFLTITFTDSAFVRPLIENRNTSINETYDYFKTLSLLDTFKLPVYFLNGVTSKMLLFKKTKIGFSGHGEPKAKENNHHTQFPNDIFRFSGYPTIFIFDKMGKTIYNKTGFIKENEKQQQASIEKLINSEL